MTKYEKIQSSIPTNNEWNLSDLDSKAKEIGLDRNEFILKAVDMFMKFDKEFLNYIKHYSEGLKLPEWLVMQNMIINRMADEEAHSEVFGSYCGIVEGFMSTIDEKGPRQITGLELKNILKDSKAREYKKQLKEIEERKNYIKSDNK